MTVREIGSLWRTRRPLYFRPTRSYVDPRDLPAGAWIIISGDTDYGLGSYNILVVCEHGSGFIAFVSDDTLEEYDAWMKRKLVFLKTLAELGQSLT